MHTMDVTIQLVALATRNMLDKERIRIANKRTSEASKEGQTIHRSLRSALQEAAVEAEGYKCETRTTAW